MSAPFDRPTSEPGGCACDECGVVFVGAEGHSLCAICNARQEAAIAALQAILKPLGTNLRHYEAWSRNPAIEAMKSVLAPVWQTIDTCRPHDGFRAIVASTSLHEGYPPTVGEATWWATAEGGEWWWSGGTPNDYWTDPISETNGPITHWQPLPGPPQPPAIGA